jgi:hypothetical protein
MNKQSNKVCLILFTFVFSAGSALAQQNINKNVAARVVSGEQLVLAGPAFKAAATYISGEPVANNTEKKIDFTGVNFDNGKNFSVATDEFVAPTDGIYHFDLRVNWAGFSAPGMITMLIRTNLFQQIPATTVQAAVTNQVFDTQFSTLLSLKAGDHITVHVNQQSGGQQQFRQVQLSGFRVN